MKLTRYILDKREQAILRIKKEMDRNLNIAVETYIKKKYKEKADEKYNKE